MFRLAFALTLFVAAPESEVSPSIAAVVESTFPTSGRQVRQQAFDGDVGTSYEAARPPRKGDRVTLNFDAPVLVRFAEVHAKGLDGGTLEGSEDGATFASLAEFHDGVARAEPGKTFKALRVVPAKDAKELIAIQEFAVDSDPALRRFQFPVEFVVDDVDDPALKSWAEDVARTCERAYDVVAGALRVEGRRPERVVRISVKNDAEAPARASGARITASAKWFRAHPDDVGSMIHETARVVQNYRGHDNPDWLAEGVAAYVRFMVYEPSSPPADDAERAPRDQANLNAARFLKYVVTKYDPDFVLKLNRAMRERTYSDELFKDATGKTADELGQEWKASLASKD